MTWSKVLDAGIKLVAHKVVDIIETLVLEARVGPLTAPRRRLAGAGRVVNEVAHAVAAVAEAVEDAAVALKGVVQAEPVPDLVDGRLALVAARPVVRPRHGVDVDDAAVEDLLVRVPVLSLRVRAGSGVADGVVGERVVHVERLVVAHAKLALVVVAVLARLVVVGRVDVVHGAEEVEVDAVRRVRILDHGELSGNFFVLQHVRHFKSASRSLPSHSRRTLTVRYPFSRVSSPARM